MFALAHGCAFVVGFCAVFITLFYVFTALEVTLFIQYRHTISIIAGLIVIAFALHTLGILRISQLFREFHLPVPRGGGFGGAFLLGVAFAAGWTPCLGPMLGAIIQLAASHSWAGLPYLLAYCTGLAIPFLLVAALTDRLQPILRALNRRMHLISIVGGVLLLAFGFVLVTDRLTILNGLVPGSPFNL